MHDKELAVLQPYCENDMRLLKKYHSQSLCGLMSRWQKLTMTISIQ